MNTKTRQQVDFYLGGLLVLLLFKPVQFVGWLLKRKHSLTEPRHVMFVKLLGGGSLLMLLPALEALKQKYPNAKFSILCSQNVKAFAKAYGVFDDVVVIEDTSLVKLLVSSLHAFFYMSTQVDTVLDLEVHSKLTTALTTMSCIRNRIGFVDHQSLWRRRLYTHAVFFNPHGQQYDQYDILAGAFECKSVQVNSAYQKFKEHVLELKLPVGLERTTHLRVALGLGCSDLAIERQAQPEQIAQVLKAFAEQEPQAEFIFLGGKADFAISQRVMELADIQSRGRNLCGPLKLDESLRVLAESQVFVGVDSALMHFARALGLKALGFWGPTAPARLLRPAPLVEKHFYQALSCSPCLHMSTSPPCQGQNVCMNHQIYVPAAVEFLLSKTEVKALMSSFRALQGWLYTPQGGAPERLELEAKYI